MAVVFHEYDLAGFRAYLENYKRRGAVLRATFLHHTWSPTSREWRGKASMESIRYSHMHRPEPMSDIACHAYATPQGTVFNARPPSVGNCACQYPDVDAHKWPPELRKLSGGKKSWMNAYGFGIETVGNFDHPTPQVPFSEDPATSVAMRTSLDVLAMVHEIWGIPVEHCFFHRDVSSKSCPGTRVQREWVHAELRRRLGMDSQRWPEEITVVALPGYERNVKARLIDGRYMIEMIGLEVLTGRRVDTSHIRDGQKKAYLTEELLGKEADGE